ncbi:MAG: hypothetical protein WAM58_08795 [Candidatus Acidiferrum sp.]
MPREKSTPLPQPVFDEGNLAADPKQFKVKHLSYNQQYKEIEKTADEGCGGTTIPITVTCAPPWVKPA